MTEKFIAISARGAEYLFRTDSMIAVPGEDAEKIAGALNEIGYKLKPGEIWHVHDNDFYFDEMIDREIKKYGAKMPVYKYYG